MKINVQKFISAAVLGLGLLSHSLPTWAGYIALSEVQVGTDFGKGTMVGARYSPDTQQYIGCSFEYSTSTPFVMCSARDKTSKSSVCTSTDAKWFETAKTITDSSYISFILAPGTTTCVYLQATNGSQNLR